MKQANLYSTCVAFAISIGSLLSGCGGGKSSNAEQNFNSSPTAVSEKRGKFIDSAVSGLEYVTGSRQGQTSDSGEYIYDTEGEPIVFYIGGIPIGNATAGSAIHVYDLNGPLLESTRGVRVAQLLQTIDVDGDAGNGIQIDEAARSAVKSEVRLTVEGTESEWEDQLTRIALAAKRRFVSIEQAKAHADSTLTVVGNDCSALNKNITIEAELGEFSTIGRTCEQKANAFAFERIVNRSMIRRISETLDSPAISEGENILFEESKSIAERNIVANIINYLTSYVEGVSEITDPETVKSKSKWIAKSLAVILELSEKMAKVHCSLESIKTICDEKNTKLAIKGLEIGAGLSNCVAGKVDACAQDLNSSAEFYRIWKESSPDNQDVATYLAATKAVAASVGLVVSTTEIRDPTDKASMLLAASNTAKFTLDATGGIYNISSDETPPTPSQYYLRVAASAIDTYGTCYAALETQKQVALNISRGRVIAAWSDQARTIGRSARCVATVTDFINQQGSQFFAMGSLTLTSMAYLGEARDLDVARMVLAELIHHGSLNNSLRHYGITADGTEDGLRKLVVSVATKMPSINDDGFRYRALNRSSAISRVVELVSLYESSTSAEGARIMRGILDNGCTTIGTAINFKADTGQAAVGSTINFSFNGMDVLYDWGDDSGYVSSAGGSESHAYQAPGVYQVIATPVVRTAAGGAVMCKNSQRRLQVKIMAEQAETSDDGIISGSRYVMGDNGTITDLKTGLTWMRCPLGQVWQGGVCSGSISSLVYAEAYTQSSKYGDGWRLPTARELSTLITHSSKEFSVNRVAFPWASTNDEIPYWGLSIGLSGDGVSAHLGSMGYIGPYNYGGPGHALLVKDGPSTKQFLSPDRPSSMYERLGTTVVLDKESGLMWATCSVGQTWSNEDQRCNGEATLFDWDDAISIKSTLAGYTDWRVPSQKELLTLVDYTQHPTMLNQQFFPSSQNSSFWSGSEYTRNPNQAWSMNFYRYYYGMFYGFVESKSNKHAVRLVRGSLKY
jgi:plastocyanin